MLRTSRCLLLPLIAAMLLMVAQPCHARAAVPLRWEQVEVVEPDPGNDYVSVTVRDNTIYVTVAAPTQVKIFTILGQPVSQATLQAGTSRFRVAARGIYILKAGSLTRRITV